MDDVTLFAKALDSAGYDLEPTPDNIALCFADYVDCGIWWDLDFNPDDGKVYFNNGDICDNPIEMAKMLISVC